MGGLRQGRHAEGQRHDAGPYYCLAVKGVPLVGGTPASSPDINVRAVRSGVRAIQLAVNRRLSTKIPVTSVYDAKTKDAVTRFQMQFMPGESSWGGVGPETAKALFLPDVKNRSSAAGFDDWRLVCGILQSESNYDPGAVGYVDDDDLGLAQINGRSHPDLSEKTRLQPLPSVTFVAQYLHNALRTFGGDEGDAIASYNLGAGGTRSWVKAGRPNPWTPAGSTTPRDVRGYIAKIRNTCP